MIDNYSHAHMHAHINTHTLVDVVYYCLYYLNLPILVWFSQALPTNPTRHEHRPKLLQN